MKADEFMFPRFKVIADYPDNKDFRVGDICQLQKWSSSDLYFAHVVEDCQGKRERLKEFFEQYPHIFKPIQWWEDREEMPDFVKNKAGEVFMFHKLRPGKNDMALIGNMTIDNHWEFLETLFPATVSEYDKANNL